MTGQTVHRVTSPPRCTQPRAHPKPAHRGRASTTPSVAEALWGRQWNEDRPPCSTATVSDPPEKCATESSSSERSGAPPPFAQVPVAAQPAPRVAQAAKRTGLQMLVLHGVGQVLEIR